LYRKNRRYDPELVDHLFRHLLRRWGGRRETHWATGRKKT